MDANEFLNNLRARGAEPEVLSPEVVRVTFSQLNELPPRLREAVRNKLQEMALDKVREYQADCHRRLHILNQIEQSLLLPDEERDSRALLRELQLFQSLCDE